jgi:hypothetical protein
MVAEISGQHSSEWSAIGEVARLLWVGCAETLKTASAFFASELDRPHQ